MTKQTQAISLLRTWLDECKIPYNSSKESLTISKADGTALPAVFDAHKVMSTDMDVAMREFHSITKAAGYGEPKPVDRGAAPLKKRIFKDNLLARWRHSEMRTVPNTSPALLKIYAPVAKLEANTYVGRNKFICQQMGYDVDVAYNDALIWTNTFLGRYQIRLDDAAKAESENKKLLTNYLRQRFVEIHKGLQRERRNVIPNDSYVADLNNEVDDEAPSEEWQDAHDEIGFKSPGLRRAKVKVLLNQNFAKMGHDNMVAELKRTSKEHPCVDTRRAAVRYLREHSVECLSCTDLKIEE